MAYRLAAVVYRYRRCSLLVALSTAQVSCVGRCRHLLAYALLPTLGTCYVATGVVDWNVLWIALPVGLITVAILHANNTRDMRTDARAEIQTLAMKLGGKASMYVYCAEVLFLWLDSRLDSCGNSSFMDPAGDAGTGSCHRQCTGGVPFSRKGRKCHSRSG